MSECCCPPIPQTSERSCPQCGTEGWAVQLQTVKALLTEVTLQRLHATHHRFCTNAACAVVYFDDGERTFRTDDIRVAVWQKEPFGGRAICYCFGETESAIRDEILRCGQSEAETRVRAHIAACRCACDVRNPKGTCCLGDLLAAISRVEASLLDTDSPWTATTPTASVKLRN